MNVDPNWCRENPEQAAAEIEKLQAEFIQGNVKPYQDRIAQLEAQLARTQRTAEAQALLLAHRAERIAELEKRAPLVIEISSTTTQEDLARLAAAFAVMSKGGVAVP